MTQEIQNNNNSISVKKATDAHQAVAALIENDDQNKYIFSSSVRCRLALSLRKLKPAMEAFMDANNKLVQKYGEEEIVIEKVDDVDTPKKTGRFIVKPSNPKWDEFVKEYKDLVEADSGIVLKPIKVYELAGVSEDAYNDPKADPSKQNQIPTKLLDLLLEVGIVTE